MDSVGVGEKIYSLRKKIQDLQFEINALDGPVQDVPELISSANLLRANDRLSRLNQKKTDLISTYAQYSGSLENMLSEVFDIQNDLKNILKDQSDIIARYDASKKTSKASTTRKPAKKKASGN